MNRIKFAFVFLVIFFPSLLFGYASRTELSISDSNGQLLTNLESTGLYLNLQTSAYYCKESDKTAGQYEFDVKVADASGKVLYTFNSGKKSLPSDENKVLVYNVKNIPSDFIEDKGFYRFDVVYSEYYAGVLSSRSPVTRKLYYSGEVASNLFDRQQVRLISPGDESVIQSTLPFFQWSKSQYASTYEVYVSENEDPQVNPVWVSDRVESSLIQYPNSARKLEVGKQYYWMVKSYDSASRAVGGTLGHSEVFTFYLGYGEATGIMLLKPGKGQSVDQELFEFRWQSLSGNFNYELILSDDEAFSNVLWSSSTSENSIIYPLESPELLKDKKYYWKVRTTVKGFSKEIESEPSYFVYNVSHVDEDVAEIPEGKAGISGQVIHASGAPVPYASVIVYPTGEQEQDTRFRDSVQTNGEGKFSIELPAGQYSVEYVKEGYRSVQKVETVKEEKILKVREVLNYDGNMVEGQVLHSVSGDPVAQAPVIIYNKAVSHSKCNRFTSYFRFQYFCWRIEVMHFSWPTV